MTLTRKEFNVKQGEKDSAENLMATVIKQYFETVDITTEFIKEIKTLNEELEEMSIMRRN